VSNGHYAHKFVALLLDDGDGVGGKRYPWTTVLLAIVYAQGALWLMQVYDYMIGGERLQGLCSTDSDTVQCVLATTQHL